MTPGEAEALKKRLASGISSVGVFVNEAPEAVAGLLNTGVIDIGQLHGSEDEAYIKRLRALTDRPIIKAFRVDTPEDIAAAVRSSADYILLDSGNGGTGTSFNWELVKEVKRPYFLAGGLNPGNVRDAVKELRPFAVDVSSGIETGGVKDKNKMRKFVSAVRGELL